MLRYHRPSLAIAFFLLIALLSPLWSGICAGAEPKQVVVVYESEVFDYPNVGEWGGKAAQLAYRWFPRLIELLPGEPLLAYEEIRIVFKKMDGVAYASGNTIVISADWVHRQPDDFGMVVHELIHLIQNYPPRACPGWVTEGIADYIRFFIYEPGKVGVKVDPKRNKYTDSYRITACFFDWIVQNKNKDFIRILNDTCRTKKWKQEIFIELTGSDVDSLWEEYTGALFL